MIWICVRKNAELSSFIFGQFPVARKLIINGGAIRPTGLLLYFPPTLFYIRIHTIKQITRNQISSTCAHHWNNLQQFMCCREFFYFDPTDPTFLQYFIFFIPNRPTWFFCNNFFVIQVIIKWWPKWNQLDTHSFNHLNPSCFAHVISNVPGVISLIYQLTQGDLRSDPLKNQKS